MHSIGDRVLGRLEEICPGTPHRDIAIDVQMTPDAFSRSLSSKRQFSSIEIARLADRLRVDAYWLITGRPDPNRLSVAARHSFDFQTGERGVPGRQDDDQIIQDVALAYRQAYREPVEEPSLPREVDKVRAALGTGFVRSLADRLECSFGIGVVRLAGLSTAYSFVLGGRRVIAVPATGNWFRENWDMAHELGHLVLGHHDDGLPAGVSEAHEAAANAFAADLLLPESSLSAIEWDVVTDADLASNVWRWGVSIDALARRLNSLLGYVPGRVHHWSQFPTQRLLRYHLPATPGHDEITERMEAASQRRFPLSLQEAHLDGIAHGLLGKGTLAWMLGVDAEELEVDAPTPATIGTDALADALGL